MSNINDIRIEIRESGDYSSSKSNRSTPRKARSAKHQKQKRKIHRNTKRKSPKKSKKIKTPKKSSKQQRHGHHTNNNSISSKKKTKYKSKHRMKKKRKKHKKKKSKADEILLNSKLNKCEDILQKLKQILPKQPMYTWTVLICMCAIAFSSVSCLLPWYSSTDVCIIAGPEKAPKIESNIYAYNVQFTMIVSVAQLILAMICSLLCWKSALILANDHLSKFPKLIRFFFILYCLLYYLFLQKKETLGVLLTEVALTKYENESGIECEWEKFIRHGEYTVWKQATEISILLCVSALTITVFRAYFIKQSCTYC